VRISRFLYRILFFIVLPVCGCGTLHTNSDPSLTPGGTLSLSPLPGTYATPQTVSLIASNTAATIYYTTDGSAPSTSSQVYAAPLNVSASSTIRALAAVNGVASATASGTYTISASSTSPSGGTPPSAPVITPTSGTYTTAQSVTLTDATQGAAIYYSIDGSTPSSASTLYTGPITVSSSVTLEAVAVLAGLTSTTASATYVISGSSTPPSGNNPPPAPVITPPSGTYTTAQSVTLTDAAAGAILYYTVDGSTPSSASRTYTGPITVSSSVTLKAVAVLAGLTSAISSSTYVINGPPSPTFAPAPGNYTTPQSVSLSDTDSNAAIYYTVDGSTPSASSHLYSTPLNISASTSVRAIAIDGTVTSQNVTGTYNFPGLSVSPASISFGAVTVNGSASQSITLTSNGAAPLTVSAATVSGSGFSLSGASFPQTLNPGQSMVLDIKFVPTSTVASTGQVVILTNAVNQSSVDVALSGQGQTGGTVSVNPLSATVSVNGTQQFTATATGLSNTAVNWSVSGAGCTGTSCGSVSTTGLYTAPPNAPNPAAVTVTATSAQNSALTGSATISIHSTGSTYYLAPAASGGSDANSGSSAQNPWLTPNHPLNCGDQIIAVPGTYNNMSFYTGKWGTVNCPAGNNVAWLTCQTFDACKIYATAGQGMWVDQSYWGVQGWEISAAASDVVGTCFITAPNWDNPVEIHHIIFADDISNGCTQGGFSLINRGSVGVDYLAVVGNIAYDAAQGSVSCTSGISIFQPVQSDSTPGTHLYVAGNFSYSNLNPSQCAGTSPTDGEGIIFDTFDGSQGGSPTPYTAQAVAENNIVIGNGGRGIEVVKNAAGSSQAPIYLSHNTSWGNLTDPNQNWLGCGEIQLNEDYNTQITANLASTKSAEGCGQNPIYAVSVGDGNGTDSFSGNFLFGYNGYITFAYGSGSFSYGANTLGVNPQFANASVPAAPSCSGTSNAPSCMASTIANFTPTASPAQGFGYQTPSASPVSDPLFPQWLCNANLPPGLVNLACQ
jgi:chitobiase/beta-hexosaminidase-like protein/ASPM-SPD-2-Hydin domain-containing protein